MSTIPFDDDQQAAVVGHSLRDPHVWERFDHLAIDENWLTSRRLGDLWPHLVAYRAEYRRPPNAVEALAYVKARDPSAQIAFVRTIEWVTKAADGMAADSLEIHLTAWARARAMATRSKEIERLYKLGDHAGAEREWLSGASDLQRLTLSLSGADRLETAATRVRKERAVRLAQAPNVLRFGIPYFDDGLRGIIPNDLVVMGGRSGAGKTEAGKLIAATNAIDGHLVDYFALEAEEFEIERRLKYAALIKLLREARPDIAGLGNIEDVVPYPEWRMARLEELLGPFEDAADDLVAAKYKNLRTYYRANGDFDVDTLERRVLEVKNSSRLIVLDHLHYVDVDDAENENRAMKKVVKRGRDLVLATGVPIILVAHLNKDAATHLVPNLEDFHGSSDIFKIATVAVVLGGAGSLTTADTRCGGYPTFHRIVKARMDPRPLRYVACSFFSKALGEYLPDYCLGQLNLAQTKWKALTSPPVWAKNATILDVQEAS